MFPSYLNTCTTQKFKVCFQQIILYYRLLLFIELISLANPETAANASLPVDKISDGGKMNPYFPVSLNSIVYEYFIFATPLAQSSDAPKIYIYIFSFIRKNIINVL